MRKDVLVGPSGEIEFHPFGQKSEACSGKRCTAFARQHCVELIPQSMKIKHVGRGVSDLRLAQVLRAPVGRLLLLGQIDTEQFARQILQAVAVGRASSAARACRRSVLEVSIVYGK